MSSDFIKKRILFVTGTRADFGKLQPLAAEAAKKNFDVTFFVTGMHMLSKYGSTKEEIHNYSEFDVIEFLNQKDGDPQDIILSKTISGFSDYLKEIQPDLVVIHGDRIEAMACSLVCATNYILSAHIEGGEVSGTIDEVLRHCNSKLCTIHMVSSEEAKRRVMQLGEHESNIFIIGSPELDIHGASSGVSIADVRNRYEIFEEEYGICIFHPVTSEVSSIFDQASALFSAIKESQKKFVVILPNNDPGSIEIRKVINSLSKGQFRVLPSMRFNYFSELMKNASIFIGNSSAGVREAPFLGIASIDIGTRQSNRALADSVTKCRASERKVIIETIKKNWNKRLQPHIGYGSGNAAEKFVEILLEDRIWNKPLQKYFNESFN